VIRGRVVGNGHVLGRDSGFGLPDLTRSWTGRPHVLASICSGT
jgi:hypothetical protein